MGTREPAAREVDFLALSRYPRTPSAHAPEKQRRSAQGLSLLLVVTLVYSKLARDSGVFQLWGTSK